MMVSGSRSKVRREVVRQSESDGGVGRIRDGYVG